MGKPRRALRIAIVASSAFFAIGFTGAISAEAVAPPATHTANVRSITPDTEIGVGAYYCNITAGTRLYPDERSAEGYAYFSDCTGAAACSTSVTLQQTAPTDPSDWYSIGDDQTSGCSSLDVAEVDHENCTKTNYYVSYRAEAIFSVVWDNGTPGQKTLYSDPTTAEMVCG
jgi:hypothetical protein